MNAYSSPYPRLELLLNTFSAWLRRRREMNEMRQLEQGEFDRIAHDLQVSPDDLDIMVRQGPHAADELPPLLKALGIDEAALASAEPLLHHDMERVCAMCRHKRQCARDAAAGTIAAHYRDYCLNVPTIDQLKQAA